MRRIGLASAATIAALTVLAGVAAIATGQPAAKAAKVHTYQLDGKPDGAPGKVRIYLHVKKNHAGKWVPKYVGAMFYYDGTFSCDEGPFNNAGFSTQNDFPVKSGDFTYNFSTFKARFTGKVTNRGKHVEGTLSYGPNDPEGHHNCVLPGSPVDYTAKYTKTTD